MAQNSPSPPPAIRQLPIVKKPDNTERFEVGGSGLVYKLSDRPGLVIKVPKPFPAHEKAHAIERRIFERLGDHPGIVKVVEMDEYGIYFEQAVPGCLSTYLKQGGHVTLDEKVNWCREIALTQQYLHEKNIRQADLCGANLLITSERKILLCDFAGSYIDGEKATIGGREGYTHPAEEEYSLPTIRSEIHALGSTIYEIITGQQIHQEFHVEYEGGGGIDDSMVGQLLREGKYPDVSDVLFGDIISKCWKGEFESAGDAAAEIIRSDPRLIGKEAAA